MLSVTVGLGPEREGAPLVSMEKRQARFWEACSDGQSLSPKPRHRMRHWIPWVSRPMASHVSLPKQTRCVHSVSARVERFVLPNHLTPVISRRNDTTSLVGQQAIKPFLAGR